MEECLHMCLSEIDVALELELKILSISLVIFLLALMGVLAPGSAHARPSAQAPIDTSGHFSRGPPNCFTKNLIFL